MNRSTFELNLPADESPASPVSRVIPGQLSWNLALTVVGLCVLFILLARRPLWHTDLWSHLLYGELIWSSKSIPATEPIMPLAAEVPLTDTAWLTQVIAYHAFKISDFGGLKCLYALSLTLCFALLIGMCRRLPQGLALGWGAAAVMGWLNWHQFQVIRPQWAGLICFMVLFAVLTRRRLSLALLWFVPFWMLLWANLHGSFVMGLGLLGCFSLGRAIDVLRRSGRFSAVLRDKRSRRLCLLLVLSCLAVMVNPYGPRLYAYVLTFSQNPNLADLTEWGRLSLQTSQGRAFAIVSVVLCVMLFFSPRRISATEYLLLAGLGGMTVWSSRMIVWFAPVAAYYGARHAAAIWNHWPRLRALPDGSTNSYFATAIASLAITFALVFYPWVKGSIGGRTAGFRNAVSNQTPVDAAEYLLVHPPAGQMFNTYEWGDYLAWTAHRHKQIRRIFVASHAHLAPREVWQDYMAVINVAPDWQARLDRHEVKTVIVDKRYRGALIALLRQDDSWKLRYEDEIAVIFERD